METSSSSETEFEVTQEKDSRTFVIKDKAARTIQRAWKGFINASIFQHMKSLIDLRRQGEPRQIVRFINPKEAELLDAAAGIHVRFRLGGVKFPPDIYYKIFTHRHVEDLCANSPRDYTKLVPKHLSHNKSDKDQSGWYRRIENNGWRPVSDRFWLPTDGEIVESQKKVEFHFSKLKRRQDIEKKRKIKKIKWMQQMYYAGNLAVKTSNNETTELIHTATKGLIRTIEEGGVDSVMEWEVDEVLNWTNTLNFDEYIANWKQIATSNSSINFQGSPFDQAQKNMYHYEDISEEASYSNAYGKPMLLVD
ncbi:protein MFI [Thomomys bottae]